ncbi:MAG: hypothetical protein BWY69_01658 [Planctomycetes bacterium ADurb.Bin401]|nr:MAG: hypothetical protein BWY69_01658 [Planctomycetes bacterium ADurb.Bin401]
MNPVRPLKCDIFFYKLQISTFDMLLKNYLWREV